MKFAVGRFADDQIRPPANVVSIALGRVVSVVEVRLAGIDQEFAPRWPPNRRSQCVALIARNIDWLPSSGCDARLFARGELLLLLCWWREQRAAFEFGDIPARSSWQRRRLLLE
jgi:hypothetical protein